MIFFSCKLDYLDFFDEETNFWWNGPDYLADEFERECIAKI